VIKMPKQNIAIENRFKNIEARLKRAEDILEISNTVTSFNWKGFTERDIAILKVLYQKMKTGASSVELAIILNLKSPQKSGRTIIYRRLRRIEAITRREKGQPIVIQERKKWYLNMDEYQFKITEG
jgi:hypothetical protein